MAADPRVAISAMQAMNDSVQNAVFFPAFFLTPVAMLAAAWLARREDSQTAAALFAAAGLLCLAGGLALTMLVNVPMNEDLAASAVPSSVAEARTVWDDYSGRWQLFNQVRAVVSGAALALSAVALRLVKAPPQT